MSNVKVAILPAYKGLNKTFVFSRFFIIISFILMLILLIILVFQGNIMIKENNLIKNYENQIDKITKENTNLEITFSQQNSSINFDNVLTENSNFEKVTKIDYIKILDSSVVIKK